LTFPVARYANLSQDQAVEEMAACDRHFYILPRILARALRSVWHRRQPLISLFGGLSYRRNLALNQEACASLSRMCAERGASRQEHRSIRIPVSPAA